MNARTRRARRRQIRRNVRQRTLQQRQAASLKRGRSLATHLLAAGVPEEDIKGVVNGLRTVAKRLGIQPVKVARTRNTVDGKGGRKARLKPVHHYTAAQVQMLAAAYKPRKAAYQRARLALAA